MLNSILNDDCLNVLQKIPNESIHLILTDLPYGINIDHWDIIHNNSNSALLSASPAQLNNPLFKKRNKPINGWSLNDRLIPLQYYQQCKKWTSQWERILVPGGNAFVFSSRRLLHRCSLAIEENGLILKDIIAWIKNKAPYKAQHLSKILLKRNDKKNANKWSDWKLGNLRPLFEPILWFFKPYKIGSSLTDNVLKYHSGAFNESAFKKYTNHTNNIIYSKCNPKKNSHPTQKPINLALSIIELTTLEKQTVLDPFCGSGSFIIAAALLNRNFIGIEKDPHFFSIAVNNLNNLNIPNHLFL